MSSLRITRARKAGNGLLCKRIALGADGRPVSDGSPCRMWAGTATRVELTRGASGLADLITDMDSSEALILGDHVAEGATIRLVKDSEADPAQGLYGRTLSTFAFKPSVPAVNLFDFDRKGMPGDVAERLEALGGFEGALQATVLPELPGYARVTRPSTSTGIYNAETGEEFPAGGGMHLYVIVRDGSDIPRFLRDAQKRAWLAGLAWIMVAGRGAKLVRSIVDITVGSPERLVFEGPPLVVAPLAQDQEARKAIAVEGDLVDTRSVCPPLTPEEEARYEALVAAAKAALEPEAEAAREAAAERLAAAKGIPIAAARKLVSASLAGDLLSFDAVEFDDDALGVVEIAAILADPKKYHGETLADPVEGPEYGRGKAKLFYNGGADVRVNSFAHGGQGYKLGHSFDYLMLEADQAGDGAPERLAELIPFAAKLTKVERERLIAKAAKISGIGRRAIASSLQDAEDAARRAETEHRARRASQQRAGATPSGGAGPAANGDPFAEFHAAVERVNRDFFVCQMGGAVPICTLHRDPCLGRESLAFMKPADFKLKFATETYLTAISRDGREIWKDLGTGWIGSNRRREYERAGMYPHGDAPDGVLNLWRGWGIEPKPGEWDKIAWHLLHIICNGDKDVCEYLIGLFAKWVQQPEKVGEVAVVMRGKKGTGKGTVADIFAEFFRHHYVHIMQAKHLTGNFNAHLADCLFLFADEVVWGGDKQGEGVLKALVTEKTIHIEPKGINSFQMMNRVKLLLASNADWCVPVTEDERRYLVLDVSDAKRGDREYFNDLHKAIKGGEAAAFLHDLLTLDISGFDYRAVPHTDGLNAQKVEGLDSVARWWMSCLDEGRIVGGPAYENSLGDTIGSAHWPGEMGKARLHYAYLQHCQAHGERHPKAENAFPRAWARYAPSVTQYKPVGAPRRWQFQGLAHHRAEFLKVMKIDSWDWGQVDEQGEDKDDNVTPFPGKEA